MALLLHKDSRAKPSHSLQASGSCASPSVRLFHLLQAINFTTSHFSVFLLRGTKATFCLEHKSRSLLTVYIIHFHALTLSSFGFPALCFSF